MKRKNNYFIRMYNNSYNFFFKKINNIKIDKSENKDLIKENKKNLKHSTALETVWLLNLKRLYDLTLKKLDIKIYHFLDVGCGNGIALIYAYKKLPFKSYSGFDFISNYIDISNKNISDSIGNNTVIIFNADAS